MADTDLIERLKFHGRYASETQAECTKRKNAEREEAATALAEKDARIAEVKSEAIAATTRYQDAENDVHNLRSQLTASRAECEGLRAALRPFAEFADDMDADGRDLDDDCGIYAFKAIHFRDARAALGQKEPGDAA